MAKDSKQQRKLTNHGKYLGDADFIAARQK